MDRDVLSSEFFSQLGFLLGDYLSLDEYDGVVEVATLDESHVEEGAISWRKTKVRQS